MRKGLFVLPLGTFEKVVFLHNISLFSVRLNGEVLFRHCAKQRNSEGC